MAQMVKHLSTMQETRVRSLGREDPLEKEMATDSSTIAWKIPSTEEPSRLHVVHGDAKSWTRLSDFTSLQTHGRRSLVGCSPWGREESDTTEQLHFHFSFTFRL